MISNTYKVIGIALLTVGIIASTPTPEVAAQGDWDVKRNPFDRSLINRYKRILRSKPNNANALGKLTRMYRRYSSVQKLVSEFEAELKKKPDSFALLIILGRLETGRDNNDVGLAYFQKAAAKRPNDANVQIAIGDMLKRSAKNREARAAFDKALGALKAKDKKLKIRVLRSLADIALELGDIDGAKKYYESYFKLDPKNVQAQIDLGDALSRHKRYDEAIKSFRAAEKRLRGDPELRVQVVARIGYTLEQADKHDDAIREYRRAIGMVSRGYYLRRDLTERIIGIYRERQRLADLVKTLEKDWPASKRSHFEWAVLAKLFEEIGLQDKALVAYRAATKKAPYELDTQRRLINLLETTGREKEALAQYEVVIKVAPGEPRFQLELAQRYWRVGNTKKALAMLKKLQKRFSGDPGVYATLADLYGRWGKEDLALIAYQKLTSIEPDESTHLVNLGEQYYQRNQKQKALAVWKKIIRKKNAASYARLGQVYADHDLRVQALEAFTKAIALDGKKPKYYQGRAGVYERHRSFPSAIADWEKVLSLTPDREANRPARREARRRIVNLLMRNSSRTLNARIAAWERAFRGNPADVGAGYFLVEAYLRQNKNTPAKTTLERLLSLNPKDTEAMHELVKVYRASRDHKKAIALLTRLVEITPARSRDYYTQIAEILRAQRCKGCDEQAILYSQKALEKSPNDPTAHLEMAKGYYEMTRYDQAIKEYELVLKYDPRNTIAYFALARIYAFRSQHKKEAGLYRELLSRSGDEEVLLRAGRAAINLAANVPEMLDELGQLERTLARLAFTYGHKIVYRRVLVELYGRYVPLLVDKRNFGTAKQKKAASIELARLGTHGLKPLLDALADDKDGQQQRTAVAVLGYTGNRAAAPALVRLALEANRQPKKRVGTLFSRGLDWNVRVDALIAAGRLGDPRTLPDLITLTKHREVAMREAATFALGRTGDAKAVGPLISKLTDGRPSVRTLACLGLARIAPTRAADNVIGVFASARNSERTRAACAFAAGAIGAKSAVTPLIDVLREGNDEPQRLAAYALGRIADRRAIDALIGAYFTKRGAVRETVAWALARTVSASARDRKAVLDTFEYVPRHGKFDGQRAIESLGRDITALPISAVALAAHEKAITAGVRGALERHRDLVVRTLIDLDSRPRGLALGILTTGLDSMPARSRGRIDKTLATIGHSISGELARLTSHQDVEVRRRALSVLAKLGDQKHRKAIEAGLRDKVSSVRVAAAAAAATYFEQTGDKAIAAVLAGTLKGSKRWDERLAACRALGSFQGVEQARGALGSAAKTDTNGIVRSCAEKNLRQVGP